MKESTENPFIIHHSSFIISPEGSHYTERDGSVPYYDDISAAIHLFIE